MDTKKLSIAALVAVVIVGGGSFYAGMKYGQRSGGANRIAQAGQFRGMAGGQRQGGGVLRMGGAQGGFVNGEIIAKDNQSITVRMPDNSSKIVVYSASTTIGKMADGTANDLAVGTGVTVVGSAGSDGVVTAQSIQIRNGDMPFMRGTTTTMR